MNTSLSLRARKQAATHEALYQAALRRFEANGYEDTTVDQIAADAGVSRRTFFRYFDSKEAVVFAKQPELVARFQALVDDAGGGGFAAVRDAFLGLANAFAHDRRTAICVQSIIDSSPSLTAADVARDLEWETVVTEVLLRSPGAAADEDRARWMAGAIVGMLRAMLRDWRRNETEGDLPEMARETLELLERGFGAAVKR